MRIQREAGVNKFIKLSAKYAFILAFVLFYAFSCTRQKVSSTPLQEMAIAGDYNADEQVIDVNLEPKKQFIEIQQKKYNYIFDNEILELLENYAISKQWRTLKNIKIEDVQYVELQEQNLVTILASYIMPGQLVKPSTRVWYDGVGGILFFLNNQLKITKAIPLSDYTSSYMYDIAKELQLDYDFVKDIPGRQAGKSSVVIGDYNKDGYDDIIVFDRIMHGYIIRIICYNPDNGFELALPETEIVCYNEYITWDRGPPIQFGSYNSMDGFMLYEAKEESDRLFHWYFYTWDNEKRQFKKIKQVNPDANIYLWNNQEDKYVKVKEVVPDNINFLRPQNEYVFRDGKEYNIINEDLKEIIANRVRTPEDKIEVVIDDIRYVDFKIPGYATVAASYRNPKPSDHRNSNDAITQIFVLDTRFEKNQDILFELPDTSHDTGRNYDFIPGKRVGNSGVFVGDFNKDGYDEIIVLRMFSIFRYDSEQKRIVRCKGCGNMSFNIPPPEMGSFIQFVKYQGKEGFILSSSSGGLWHWNFHYWDNSEKQYKDIQRINYNEVRFQ